LSVDAEHKQLISLRSPLRGSWQISGIGGISRQGVLIVVVGLLSMVLVWLASTTRPWAAMDAKVFDLFTTWTAPRNVQVPLVILAIDEPSFQELQMQWPFPRTLHAKVLERLRADGAVAVGFDMVFAEPSNRHDDELLAAAIRSGPPVVLAASYEQTESRNASQSSYVMPLDLFLTAGAVAGQVQVAPDDDFVVRRSAAGDDSFSSRMATLGARAAGFGSVKARAELIEYLGPRASFDTRSYYQALDPELLPPGFFAGKIVLIGRAVRTAVELTASQSDMFNSPFVGSAQDDKLFPGVEVHANLISNLLTGGGLNTIDDRWVAALLLSMVLVLGGVGLRSHPGVTVAVVGALLVGVWLLSLWLFASTKIWMTPLLPMVTVVALYASSMLINYMASRRRALQTRMMFSQYVPQEVVSRLVDHPELLKLGGEARELTLMFTDLANFTTMSERLTAEATVEVLTEYFNAMTPIIHRYGGTVDKFIGDAVMAFWGAPLDDAQHGEHAVRAAIDMQVAMEQLATRLVERGLPAISMRVGLHSGRVVVGNIGSDSRFSYTVIGDAVNLAARLEGANKAFGTGILLSDATATDLPDDLTLRHLDRVIVKGKSEAINVYCPCQDAALANLSAQAVQLFYTQQWVACEQAFRTLLLHKPHDYAAMRFLTRLEEIRAKPAGQAWTGALSLDKL
jgi:adenylate cyclase